MGAIPEAGDIAWVDLDPVKGTEQSGRRPCIVLTGYGFNSRDHRSIICPITTNMTPWPTKVFLPDAMRIKGAILADQPRSIHRHDRGFRFIETAPHEVLTVVRKILRELLSIDPASNLI